MTLPFIPTPYQLAAKVGAMALVVLAFGWLWYSRSGLQRDVADLSAQRDSLAAANEDARKAMARLETLRAQESVTLAALQDQLQAVTARDRDARRRIAEIGRTDVEARGWMQRPLPPALGCVLADAGCGEAGDRGGAPAGSAPASLPASRSGGAADERRPRRGSARLANRGARVRGPAARAHRVARGSEVTVQTLTSETTP